MKLYSIGEFAKLTCTSISALRYYDEINLLIPADIKNNNYRYYSLDQIHTIEWIKHLKNAGMSLKDIEKLIHDDPHDQLELLVDSYLALVKVKKDEIQKMNWNIDRITKKRDIYKQAMANKDKIYERHFKKGYLLFVCEQIKTRGEAWNLEIYDIFKDHNSFEEFTIIQKGYIYDNYSFETNLRFSYVELVDEKDKNKFSKNNVFRVPEGIYKIKFSYEENLNENIKSFKKLLTSQGYKFDLIIVEKLMPSTLIKHAHSDCFEIQIMTHK